MQVELIGCTGAGKSTFAEHFIEECAAKQINAVTSVDYLLGKVGLNWVSSRIARALLIDVVCLPGCIGALLKDPAPLIFGIKSVFSLKGQVGVFNRINLLRNVVKKFGVYHLIGSASRDDLVIVVDEGTLHAAHNLFVHVDAPPDIAELDRFAELVPLPNLAVRVMQEKETLVERTLARGHSRVRDPSSATVGRFITHAEQVFDHLVDALQRGDRLVGVGGRSHVLQRDGAERSTVFTQILPLLEGDAIKAVVSRSQPTATESNAK